MKWISVKDRLPKDEKNNNIICLVNCSYWGIVVKSFDQYHNCWYDKDGDDFYCDAVNGKITHWILVSDLTKIPE